MTDQHAEHLRDSAPCNSRFDGFCRGDSNHDDEPFWPWLFTDFSQANAQAKRLAQCGRRVRVKRLADDCFEVIDA